MKFTEVRINIVRGFIRIFGRLPLRFHYFWGDVMSWIMYHILHYRKEVVFTNIARSFPQMPYGDVKNTAKKFYRHFGEIIAEAIWFGASDYKRLHKAGICRITNLPVLLEAYEKSPSITVLGSHCGNWELIGGMWGYNYDSSSDFPDDESCIKVVYRELRSKVWDEVMKRNRANPIGDFHGMVETNMILRHALKHREKKFIYLYYADQFPYATKHDVGIFLNQKTYGMLGAVALAHKLGMSVLFMKMNRIERGHYELEFVPISMDASKDDPDAMLKQFFALLEDEIKKEPSNWLWSHKRWK